LKRFSLWNNSIISLDLGSFETKAVLGSKRKNDIKINKAFSFETPKDAYMNGYIKNQNALINTIKDELIRNSIKSGTCYLSIKSTAIITREIAFPVLGTKEIEGLLKYQLPEFLPMDYSKYIIQHKILDKFMDIDKEKLNVLVVAIPKDMVDMHYELVRELGFKPAILDYQSNSVGKFLKYVNKVNESIDPSNKTIAAIDLGYDSTNVTIIDKGIMQTTRTIDMGGITLDNNTMSLIAVTGDEMLPMKSDIEDVSMVEEGFSDYNRYVNAIKTSIESIITRIDRVFKFYLSKDINNEIEKLILYGGLSNIKGVDKLFFNYFGIPAVVLNNVDRINFSSDLNKYVNCIGTLMRDDEVQTNE